jgi:hypothetical protein
LPSGQQLAAFQLSASFPEFNLLYFPITFIMNKGSSPYHAIQGVFCRGCDEELLSVEGRNAGWIVRHWPALRVQMRASQAVLVTLPSGTRVATRTLDLSGIKHDTKSPNQEGGRYTVRELYHQTKECYLGLLTYRIPEPSEQFWNWIETFFLLETSLRPHPREGILSDDRALQITEHITRLFESSLRNIPSNDEWNIGRNDFYRKVLGFVVRNERIQMICPAFPCKSPNPRKVAGQNPDMAEYIALKVLHTFGHDVRSIYPPGMIVWIISDGHVFSDCSKFCQHFYPREQMLIASSWGR